MSFPILKAANYLENYRKIKILQIKHIEFQEGNDVTSFEKRSKKNG